MTSSILFSFFIYILSIELWPKSEFDGTLPLSYALFDHYFRIFEGGIIDYIMLHDCRVLNLPQLEHTSVALTNYQQSNSTVNAHDVHSQR